MVLYLFIILSLVLCQYRTVYAGHAAFCYLTRKPTPELLEFARELAQDTVHYGVEVLIMIDDNNFNVSNISTTDNLRLLQLPNEQCLQHNYRKTIWLGGQQEVTAWDKALLYFNVLNTNYSFVWLKEDDIFLPTVQAFRSVHELYSNTSDFIVPRVGLNLEGNPSIWLYSMAMGRLLPPWACSMVNIVGLSRRMLTALNEHVQWLGQVPFHEFFFNTLAIHKNFTIVCPMELSTDIYNGHVSYEGILKQPNNFFHAAKDPPAQKHWRARLANESLLNTTTIDLVNLEMLCDRKPNMTNVERSLTDLLHKFEICKSKYSPVDRRRLRQRFSDLADRCQRQNASKEVLSLAMALANHAYKLPELPIEPLVINKSDLHLKLEQALGENKKSIFQLLPSNSSNLKELRKQTGQLIHTLTYEIQREYKEQQELLNRTRLFSTSSLRPTTITTTHLSSSSQRTTTKRSQLIFNLTMVNSNNQLLDSDVNHMKILLFITTSFFILYGSIKWTNIENWKYFKLFLITIILLLSTILYKMIF